MVCHYTKPMVPHPGPESQSLSAKKGREEGLEGQTNRPQFQQINMNPLLYWRPTTLDLRILQMTSPPYGGGIRYHCGHQSWLRERLLLRKVAFHSPPSEIRCSVSRDPYRFPEISSVLKPLLAEAPLKSPHMPVHV
ncbi:hypothetical protein NDU88_003404 [Pleurodeles waltl]|uniref:Uncharacterized protein n=1 Tax=Pleurodeles waltl TaxID=8319 RepID=A0AAV7M521_PLEWA|nr:hypothetical protein NDU88_003404 [Pleurodeles waltl]